MAGEYPKTMQECMDQFPTKSPAACISLTCGGAVNSSAPTARTPKRRICIPL